MQLAFHKRPKTFWSWLICLWTGGPYYHVALVFKNIGDPMHDSVYEAAPGFGTRVLITGRYDRFDDREWTLVTLSLSPEEEGLMQSFLAGELGCPYDWFGLAMSQVLHLAWASKTKWFCSELAVAALQKATMLLGVRPCFVSPNKLYLLTQKLLPKDN